MSSLDVSGVIGTWVGAGIGIVALVGIVGPLLVWQATRTERFKALAAIGEDSHGFITHGIPIWPNIRILRRVRAPMLQREPDFTSKQFGWDLGKLPEKSSPSGWAELGVLLKAYDSKLPLGHEIEVSGGRTYLRVHRAWVLAVGLMGRFSTRDDKGQMNSRRDRMLRFGSSHPAHRQIRFRDEDIRGLPDVQDHLMDHDSDVLHGITGIMMIARKDVGQENGVFTLEFRLASKSVLSFEPELLSLTQLFMLSIGCIPMTDNNYFSLRDLSTYENDLDDDDFSDLDHEDSRDYGRRTRPSRFTMPDDDRKKSQPRRYPSGVADISRWRTGGAQAFRLEPVTGREERLIQIGRPFAAEKTTVFSLHSFHPSHAESTTLRQLKDLTYLPASSEWIRLGETPDLNDSLENTPTPEIYVIRADAQRMALALLQLPWHPEGYLLGAEKRDDCLQLLLMCSTQLMALMGYAQRGIEQLGLTSPKKKELYDAIESLYRRIEKSSSMSRATLHEMLKLDNILIDLGHTNEQLNEMIGIMMITNREFMHLVRQSARRFDQAPDVAVTVDMRSGVLKIPSVFGILQEFPLNITELYPGRIFTDEVMPVRYSVVLIVTLRACLRSTMLRDCFSSNPLITRVLGFESTVYVS